MSRRRPDFDQDKVAKLQLLLYDGWQTKAHLTHKLGLDYDELREYIDHITTCEGGRCRLLHEPGIVTDRKTRERDVYEQWNQVTIQKDLAYE